MTTTNGKAPGACDTEGFDTNTDHSNSPTDGAINQAPESIAIAAPSIPPSPHRATILRVLTVLCVQAGVFSVQLLTTKKRHKAAMGGTAK